MTTLTRNQLAAISDYVSSRYGSIYEPDNWLEYRADIADKFEEQNGWKLIETAPKDGEPILIFMEYGKMATAVWHEDEGIFGTWYDWLRPEHSYGSVTHWMPLPEPPK